MKLHMEKKILDSLPSLVKEGPDTYQSLEQLQKHKHVRLEHNTESNKMKSYKRIPDFLANRNLPV